MLKGYSSQRATRSRSNLTLLSRAIWKAPISLPTIASQESVTDSLVRSEGLPGSAWRASLRRQPFVSRPETLLAVANRDAEGDDADDELSDAEKQCC
jgi:hypothetical protein